MRIRHDQAWDASEYHIPCLAHIINLAVQAFLTNFRGTAENDDELVGEEDDDDSVVPISHETGT